MDSMIPDKDEMITALQHVVEEQQNEIKTLNLALEMATNDVNKAQDRIDELQTRLSNANWMIDNYRDTADDRNDW